MTLRLGSASGSEGPSDSRIEVRVEGGVPVVDID